MYKAAMRLVNLSVEFFYFICSPTGQSFCLLGWSDLALFAIFEKLHVSADQVYWKNRQISLRVRIARAAKFSFSGNLIMNIFV